MIFRLLDILVYQIRMDHLGTPLELVNAANDVVWRAHYESFGNAVIEDDVDGDGTHVAFNVRMPGQYFDVGTGLSYNLNRYYDPATGRYVTSDPIGLLGGVNTFAYVGNSPLINIDPTGKSGLYLGLAIQGSAPFLTAGGNAMLVGGSNGGGTQLVTSASTNTGNTSFGLSFGRGLVGGFFVGDISNFLKGSSFGIDTPRGGISLLFGPDGSLIGLGLTGPSLGISANGNGGTLSGANPSISKTLYNSVCD